MINKDTIRYSLRNLNKSKNRNILTVLSILIGITTIFIFISFGMGLYNYTEEIASGSSADKLLISSKGGGVGADVSFGLGEDDLKSVQRATGVYEATGMHYRAVEVEFKNEIVYPSLISYDPKIPIALESFNVELEKGRLLNARETKKAVLGYNYLIDGKIFDKALALNDIIEINEEKVKVVGFLESVGSASDDAQIYITNEYYENLFENDTSFVQIIARADISRLDTVVLNVERSLRKSRDLEKGKEDFFVQTFEDMIESFSIAIDIIVGFIILIALISIVVSAVNTANTMITSVLERFKEIGILKSIGARNSEIFGIFLFESGVLGLSAGILGVLLGILFTKVGSIVLDNLGYGFLQPDYSWILILGCILFAVVTGIISGVLPARRASKINTVDALRYE